MARKNAVRDALLAEVKARRRAAGQKVSRLERAGVRVRDANLDPRLSNTALEGLNARQLRSHLSALNAFTSRSNSYVPGLRGAPLSGATVREYRRLEAQHIAASAAFLDSVGNLSIPGMGATIGQRLEDRSRRIRRGGGDYTTFALPDKDGVFQQRSMANITGQDGLRRLLEQLRKKTDPRYAEREARAQRRTVNKMLERTSNTDLIALLKDVSDEEFITLTQYTDFMTTLESSYAMAKSISSDTPRWQSAVYEDNEDKIRDWAEWAHRHFTDRQDTDEENPDDDARAGRASQRRDRYGRFIRFTPGDGLFNPDYVGQQLPEPVFKRDAKGRFAPGRGKFNPKL